MEESSQSQTDRTLTTYQPHDHTNHTSLTILKFEQFCGITYIFLFLLGTAANLLAMGIFLDFSLWKKGRKLLISTVLFLHLASSDLLTSLFVLSFNGFAFLNKNHQYMDEPFKTVCTISGAFFNICSRQSCNIFALLSFVRCVAIVRPFKHGIWFTKFRINLVLAVTWMISVLMSCMVFLIGKSYVYNDHVTLCTWTLDDLGLGNVGKDWRSVSFFCLVLLPIFLPVTFTFVCLSILIIYFSKNSKSRDKVRISLADMVEISEGFAQAMRNMLDSKEKLKRSLSSRKLPVDSETSNNGSGSKSSWVVYRRYYQTMKNLKSRKVFLHLSNECDDTVEQTRRPTCPLNFQDSTLGSSTTDNERKDDNQNGETECHIFSYQQGSTIKENEIKVLEQKDDQSSSILKFKERMTRAALTPKLISRKFIARIQKGLQDDKTGTCPRRRAAKSQSHAFITLIIIGITFVLCYSLWCYFFICGFLITINPNWNILTMDTDTIVLTMTSAILMINLSSIFTPCIHITRGNNLRNKLKGFGKSSRIIPEKGTKIIDSVHH